MTNIRARIIKRKIKNVKSRRDIKRKRALSQNRKRHRREAESLLTKNEIRSEGYRMSKIYKYFSHEVISRVFDREGFCGVKCSLPKDYNDPFELFLGMDLNVPTEHLAFYNDVVQGIPQNPTTCFSLSPIVSPMWAHYANNHSGFVLEFDLEKLQNHFKGNPIWEVSYRTAPHEGLKQKLAMAAELKKPRYSYQLQQYVFSESYFTKYKEWEYELECRFVDMNSITEKDSGNNILFIPIDAVTSIIAGPNSSKETVAATCEVADENDLNWFQLHIGKSHPKPYLRDFNELNYTFKDGGISQHDNKCESCTEPLFERDGLCPWCSITESHEDYAAQVNPFRMMDRAGILDDYISSMNNISTDD